MTTYSYIQGGPQLYRVYVSIAPADNLKNALLNFQTAIHPLHGDELTSRQSMHLTVTRPIDNVTEDQFQWLQHLLEEAMTDQDTFQLGLSGAAGAFNSSAGSTIWAAVSWESIGPLMDLRNRILQAYEAARLPTSEMKLEVYQPHITLIRRQSPVRPAELPQLTAANMSVKSIRLCKRPMGSRYSYEKIWFGISSSNSMGSMCASDPQTVSTPRREAAVGTHQARIRPARRTRDRQ